MLRVSPELHRRLRERARADGISLNSLCARLLDTGTSGESGRSARVILGLPHTLVEQIGREWSGKLVGVALFGSAARGNATSASDIDLLVVLEPGTRIERSLYDRWEVVMRAGGVLSRRVSPQFVALPATPSEAGGIWLEVAREGIVLDDRESRLARFLISLRDLIASGAVTRKTVHGHPYWVREGKHP